MNVQDLKIDVEPGKRKIVAEIICDEIKKSLDENKRFYERAQRNEDAYSQVSYWQRTGKVCNSPWPGAADYFIPLTEWVIDAVHARVMNILFQKEPYMEATGVEAADVDKANDVTDFIDMILREKVKIYDNINFFFKQVIKLPFSVLKYDWAQEFDKMIVKEKALTFTGPNGEIEQVLPDAQDAEQKKIALMTAGYVPSGEEEVHVMQDVELENQAKLQYIRFADYVWSPNAKRGTRLYWEGDRCWFTINEMLLKVAQEKFDQDSVRRVIGALQLDGKEGVEKAIAQRAELREAFNWYGRLPFNKNNEIDFNADDAIEQEVFAIVDYKEKELLYLTHWYHHRKPFPDRVYIREVFEETEGFDGRSLVDKLFNTQKELNTLHNTIMNNAWLAMQKIFVKRSTLTGEEWERPKVYPGAIWTEDMAGDIRVLEVGDIKQIGMQIEQTLLNFAERVSNISIFQTGTARQEGGNKTLGEVEKTISEGNVGLDKFIQRCHNVLRKICQWTLDYYVSYMPPGLDRRIAGEGKPGIEVSPYWTQDDISGQFDFTWRGTSLNSSKEYQVALANDLMDRMLPQPMIGGSMIYTWEILKNNFVSKGIKDWQKYLPKREVIIAEMERQQQEAHAMESQSQLLGRDRMRQAIAQKLSPQGGTDADRTILPAGRG